MQQLSYLLEEVWGRQDKAIIESGVSYRERDYPPPKSLVECWHRGTSKTGPSFEDLRVFPGAEEEEQSHFGEKQADKRK